MLNSRFKLELSRAHFLFRTLVESVIYLHRWWSSPNVYQRIAYFRVHNVKFIGSITTNRLTFNQLRLYQWFGCRFHQVYYEFSSKHAFIEHTWRELLNRSSGYDWNWCVKTTWHHKYWGHLSRFIRSVLWLNMIYFYVSMW